MKILVLPGDGIGPEISAATVAVLRAADERFGLDLSFTEAEIGLASLARVGTTMPDSVYEQVAEADGTILGPVSHYEYPARAEGGINPSGALRTHFSLYSNVRPARSVPDLSVLRQPMDLVIVRENTEGFYADRVMHGGQSGEFMPDADMALSIRKITRRASTEVARTAFALAETRRNVVTAVHKANVLRMGDGLFLEAVRAVADEHPGVQLREIIVDAAAARFVRAPGDFDVIVTTNMFGDILSDLASELCGSLGLGGSLNAGADVGVAQAQHGSAPDIQGQGVANPVSLVRSAAMLLQWHAGRSGRAELASAGEAIDAACTALVENPQTRTRDLGGTLDTEAATRAIIANILT